MKHTFALIGVVLAAALLAGCRGAVASFSLNGSEFSLRSNGTYTQTFTRRADCGSYSGDWQLTGPNDGTSPTFEIQLFGVHRWPAPRYDHTNTIPWDKSSALPSDNTTTLVVPARRIHSFDRLLREMQSHSTKPAQ